MIIFLIATLIFAVATFIYLFLFVAIVYHTQEYLPPESKIHHVVVIIFALLSIVFWVTGFLSLLAIPH